MIERAGLAALRNLDCTMLLCNEIEPMRSFYVDLLGLDVQREIAGRYLELRIGATTLAFRLRTRPYDGRPRSTLPDRSNSRSSPAT
ncbi:MAG: hypothetical protein R2710_05940 [Acidimicrobiales bacterium]